jgi:hypothetical protein
MKKILLALSIASISTVAFNSCDEHFDFPDTAMKVGDVLCTDGEVLHYDDYENSGKEAIGIVFYINNDTAVEGKGYAVYIRDLGPEAFSDTTSVSQKTSADLNALDGNANTYAMFENASCGSPLAEEVFALWRYGQSAYIPSVAQYRLLYAHKALVNPCLMKCGGEVLSDEADQCWYWTSTEVGGQTEEKAWLFSMHSSTIQETPKYQEHKARPIITINY